MFRHIPSHRAIVLCGLIIGLILAAPRALTVGAAAEPPRLSGLMAVDIDLPSDSTGAADGTLAVRLYVPRSETIRYPEGAPVIIWILGGFEAKGLSHGLPATASDVICITFIFPGGEDPVSGRSSDGIYDFRGECCIAALRDVIRFAAGKAQDARGRTIDEVTGIPVLHGNIGVIGESNGGNLPVAAAALHGDALEGALRYIIQWETPVSSQIATRDLGRIWLKPSPRQGDFWNPRLLGYGPQILPVDYVDLVYNPASPTFPLFHDGNGDGAYTTVLDPRVGLHVPDLDLNGTLSHGEDFPLDAFAVDDVRVVYSRPVTRALTSLPGFATAWPSHILTLEEANAYWTLREAVSLTEDAMEQNPTLEAMVLCGVRDHVQATPGKPHIRQAFDSWNDHGAWVRINPSAEYLVEAEPALSGQLLPSLGDNASPADWFDVRSYAMPIGIPKPVYQLAAIHQMADRARSQQGVQSGDLATPRDAERGGWMTTVESEGIGTIAIHVSEPATPRYRGGAPVIVSVSGFFTASHGFKVELDPDALGTIYITYVWPGQIDPRTGATSDGVFDYGGPDCLAALRDVIRFATGEIPNTSGRFLHDLTAVAPMYDVAGIYAFSHSGVAATNALAIHGDQLQRVRFFVGRENPTLDALYPLEPGHWSEETGRATDNPF